MTQLNTLDLSTKRQDIIDRHSWVKELYRHAVALDNDIDSLKDRLSKASKELAAIDPDAILPMEIRADKTHLLVDQKLWQRQKDQLEKLNNTLCLWQVGGIVTWATIIISFIIGVRLHI